MANALKLLRPGAVGLIPWLGRNGSMSRQRLWFACEQRMEVFETLIGSREDIDVVETLPLVPPERDPNILMSVVISCHAAVSI